MTGGGGGATYVVLCLFVPLLWGIVATRLFDWWQARRRSAAPPATQTEAGLAERRAEALDMYHI